MNKLLSTALIGMLALACQETQKEETVTADPNAITCEGIGLVKLTHSYADLENEFGADKLENGTAEVGGNTVNVTRIFPNEAEEITVYWAESQEPYTTATKLTVANNFGPYQTAEGLRVGSTLDEVKKFNNFMPLTMTNFYNSFDGFADVTNFNGGDIEVNLPCIGAKLDIVKQRGVDVATLDEIKSEAELQSSHKIFNTLDVEVVELSVESK